MSILGFFKKLKLEKEKAEITSTKLTFSEIGAWLDKKNRENEVAEEKILLFIKARIKIFNVDLRAKIIILNQVDVKLKKSEDRIKEIVSNSREKYIETVENLIINLENLKETKFSNITKKINKLFFDFSKASFKNYERSTILIGKEMADIKTDFKTFSKDLLKIFEDNKEILEIFQKIESIKVKLSLLGPLDKSIMNIKETIVYLNEKIEEKEEENNRLLNEIKRIQQSNEYKNKLKEKEKIIGFEKDLKNDVFNLKQLIDFKSLINFFHINEEQMKILKDYKDDFHTYFEKDNGKIIMALLDEAKLNNNFILEKVNLIKTKTEKIKNYKKNIKKDETLELQNQIKEIIIQTDNLKIKKIKEEKRDETLKENKEKLTNSLKKELSKMNIELV